MKIKTGQVVYCEKLGIYHKFTGDHVHDVRPLTPAEAGVEGMVKQLEQELLEERASYEAQLSRIHELSNG